MAYQRNGCVKSRSAPHLSHTVPEFHQVQVDPEPELPESPEKCKDKDHCTIEISELETNV